MADGAHFFANSVTAMAVAQAQARMARVLLDRCVIERGEYDAMRHLFLHAYDAALAMEGLREDAVAAIHESRLVAERFWDLRADVDAEPGKRPPRL